REDADAGSTAVRGVWGVGGVHGAILRRPVAAVISQAQQSRSMRCRDRPTLRRLAGVRAERREPPGPPTGRARVVGRVAAALRQAGDQLVDDVVQPGGDQPRRDVQAVDRAEPGELHEAIGDLVVAAGEGAAAGTGLRPGELEDGLALLRGLLAPGP